MSFRLYFYVNINATETDIYNNTEKLANYTDFDKIVLVGINCDLSTANLSFINSASTARYVEVDLPVYQISKKRTYQYAQQQRYTDTKNNGASFQPGLMSMATDYILVYINNLNGVPVEKSILSFLESRAGVTKLRDSDNITRTRGSWAALLKPKQRDRFNAETFTVLTELYSEDNDINLYYLTHTESQFVDKERWNQLFADSFSTSYIKNYFEQQFSTMDSLIYEDSSNYVQILAKIHHHMVHPRDDNFDGEISQDDLEQPWYQIYPEQLVNDQLSLRNTIELLSKTAKLASIPQLSQEDGLIIKNTRNSTKFLSVANINNLLTFRNLYIAIRTEFVNNLALDV